MRVFDERRDQVDRRLDVVGMACLDAGVDVAGRDRDAPGDRAFARELQGLVSVPPRFATWNWYGISRSLGEPDEQVDQRR